MTAVLDRPTRALSRFAPPTLTTLPHAVAANVAEVRRRTAATVMAVVKADGYGLGAVPVARAAVDAGAGWLGLTDIADAASLRDAGLRVPMLAWLHPAGIDVRAARRSAVDVAVGSVDELRRLIADVEADVEADDVDGAPVRVHLNLDTGMARGGCPIDEWSALLRVARGARDTVEVRGIMGHLPRAEEGTPEANAAAVQRLRRGRDAALRDGLGPVIVHLAATAGTLADPATHFDMVRIGAGLVGIDPSETVALTGAARLTAAVVHTARVRAGTSVGYGGGHVVERATHLSVLGLGYADGIPRELSPAASVEIGGRRHPIVGRVSMDQIVVDTGDEVVPRGTIATVFGPDGGAVPSVQEWARWAGTIPHTILTGIGARVQRSVA